MLELLAVFQSDGTSAEFDVDHGGGGCTIGRDRGGRRGGRVADPDPESLGARVEDEGERPHDEVQERGGEVDGLYVSCGSGMMMIVMVCVELGVVQKEEMTYSSGIVELGPAAETGKHEEATEDADPEKDHADADDLFEAEDFDKLGTEDVSTILA